MLVFFRSVLIDIALLKSLLCLAVLISLQYRLVVILARPNKQLAQVIVLVINIIEISYKYLVLTLINFLFLVTIVLIIIALHIYIQRVLILYLLIVEFIILSSNFYTYIFQYNLLKVVLPIIFQLLVFNIKILYISRASCQSS